MSEGYDYMKPGVEVGTEKGIDISRQKVKKLLNKIDPDIYDSFLSELAFYAKDDPKFDLLRDCVFQEVLTLLELYEKLKKEAPGSYLFSDVDKYINGLGNVDIGNLRDSVKEFTKLAVGLEKGDKVVKALPLLTSSDVNQEISDAPFKDLLQKYEEIKEYFGGHFGREFIASVKMVKTVKNNSNLKSDHTKMIIEFIRDSLVLLEKIKQEIESIDISSEADLKMKKNIIFYVRTVVNRMANLSSSPTDYHEKVLNFLRRSLSSVRDL